MDGLQGSTELLPAASTNDRVEDVGSALFRWARSSNAKGTRPERRGSGFKADEGYRRSWIVGALGRRSGELVWFSSFLTN